MESPRFHHLYSQSMRPLNMVEERYQEALQSWLCQVCKEPRPGSAAIDIVVEEEETRSKTALNVVLGAGLTVARKDLLFSLGVERVLRDLHLGTVRLSDGSLLEELVTFRGSKQLLVRGNKCSASTETGGND